MWMSWETPCIFTGKQEHKWARYRLKAEGESVRRGGGVEMCSQSPLESYNFIPLILRGWKLLLSPHLRPCRLLFCCMHFLPSEERRGSKVSIGGRKREERKRSYIRQPVLLLWLQCLNARIPQEESFAAESTQLQETKYINNDIISNPDNIT